METNLKRLGFFLTISFFLAAAFIAKKPTALPVTEQLIKRHGYTLCYNYKNRQAVWIKEILKAEDLEGNANREEIEFKADTLIPEQFRAVNKDYVGSRYDRGHLKPAGDCKASQAAMEESFYLSNVSPQNHQNNAGIWLKLERHVRQLAKENGSVTVYTGGCYLPKEKNGRKYIKYQLIGEHNVSVPNAFFKIALAEGIEEAYLVPNKAIETDQPLENYRTSIKKIEAVAGIIFPK